MREPEHNISHKSMPCYGDHAEFVQSMPYRWWDLITSDVWFERFGVGYVTKNDEIGLYLWPAFRKLGYGSLVLDLYKNKTDHLFANIAKSNLPSQAFFKKCGFVLKEEQPEQFVYEWRAHNVERADHSAA